jgi:hypothetical protein
MHENPLLNPVRAFQAMDSFEAAYRVLFEGRRVMSDSLPVYYLPKYILITTPPLALFFFLFGMAGAIYRQWRDIRSPESLLYLVVQLWFLFPLFYVMARRANIYDGVRHFLFILPALALMAAIGVSFLVQFLSGRYRKPVYLLLAVAAVFTAGQLVRLHPYQMTYFNFLVGGVKRPGKIMKLTTGPQATGRRLSG